MNRKKIISMFLASGVLIQGYMVSSFNKIFFAFGEDNLANESGDQTATKQDWFSELFDDNGKLILDEVANDMTGLWSADGELLDDALHNVVIIDKGKETVLTEKDKKEFTQNKTVRLDTENASWLYTIGGESIDSKLLDNFDLGVVVTDFGDRAKVDALKISDGAVNVLSGLKKDPLLVCFAAEGRFPDIVLVEIYLGNIEPGEYIPYCVYHMDGKSYFVRKNNIVIGKSKKIRTKVDKGCDFVLVKADSGKNIIDRLKSYETK